MERPTEAIQGLAPESQALTPTLEGGYRDYYVSFDGRHWNVSTGDGKTGPSSLDRSMAITLAIRAARHDYAEGLDAAVSVEERDGSFSLAWASA
jgi:hypothetical protein